MFVSYGNNSSTSQIDAEEAERIINKCISIIDDLNEKMKEFTRDVEDITQHWNGGGKTKESALYSSVESANQMYEAMLQAVNYAKDLVVTTIVAGNDLYHGYNPNEDLFPRI